MIKVKYQIAFGMFKIKRYLQIIRICDENTYDFMVQKWYSLNSWTSGYAW